MDLNLIVTALVSNYALLDGLLICLNVLLFLD